jgi:DNA-binding NtrC family response regulator
MADGARITVADLPEEMSRNRGNTTPVNGTKVASAAGLREKLRRIEAEVVLGTIEECGGDRRAAAELLEISVSSLYRKLQEYEMDGFFDGKTQSLKK